ncbi:MAG: hypothetical protein CVV16_03385 [Gammaproteobacteria bacterium HGW-Gammaproteobacteria-6]|nr:MAG: hypothetical protein CVV16_03385 [Gammaproteobacteria bacterium HGW-Gammaproteobacteria-6]
MDIRLLLVSGGKGENDTCLRGGGHQAVVILQRCLVPLDTKVVLSIMKVDRLMPFLATRVICMLLEFGCDSVSC